MDNLIGIATTIGVIALMVLGPMLILWAYKWISDRIGD